MKTPTVILLALVLLGCRTRSLSAVEPTLAGHVDGARATYAPGGGPETAMTAERVKIAELQRAWEDRLARPGGLSLIRDFEAAPYRAARVAARKKTFASSLEHGLTETQLLGAVFERNPGIRAAFLLLRSKIDQYAQVTHLDAILSQYAAFQRSSNTRVGMPLAGERMDQHFPFPGSLELKAALVTHAVEESRARYAEVVQQAIAKARTLGARHRFVLRATVISQATERYLVQLEDAARAKYAAGSAPKGVVIQVQVELADLRNQLITLAREAHVIQAALASLLDVPPTTSIHAPIEPALPTVPAQVATLRTAAGESQPRVLAIEARVRRMQTMIELAEQMTYPAFSAGLSTMEGISHATGGSDKEREPFGTRPKIRPDPWFGSKEAYLREARQKVGAALARAQTVRNQVAFEVQDAHTAFETAARRYHLFQEVQLAQAEQAYRDASAGYAADRVEFLNVIDTLRRWLRFRLEADRAVRDMHSTHARLERAVGAAVSDGA